MIIPKKLYHGTCKEFVAYAQAHNGQFGPSYDRVSFTPDLKHSYMFSESWNTKIGIETLKEYFGEEIDPKLAEAVILQFNGHKLGNLHFKKDGGADEFFVEKGPVQLVNARIK